MEELTEKQKNVLMTIKKFIKEHGYSPTMRELSSILNIQVKGAYDHLIALRKKGVIEWESKKFRTIRIKGGING